MSIWDYSGWGDENFLKNSIGKKLCIYCGSRLYKFPKKQIEKLNQHMYDTHKWRTSMDAKEYEGGLIFKDEFEDDWMYTFRIEGLTIRICPSCGWWWSERTEITNWPYEVEKVGVASILKNFDSLSTFEPIEEVTNYLMAKYEYRHHIEPEKFENVVASIYNGLGFKTRVTSYHKDNGIDIYMDGDDDKLIGVQVKRYKNKIKTEYIRSFGGALMINDCTEGVFITTSNYQKGCELTAKKFEERGKPIKLVNAENLFDALKISKINSFDNSIDKFINMKEIKYSHLKTIRRDSIP